MKRLVIGAAITATIAFVTTATASMPGPNQLTFLAIEAVSLVILVGLVAFPHITKKDPTP